MRYTRLSKRKQAGGFNGKITTVLLLLFTYLIYGQMQYSKAINNGYDMKNTKKEVILIQKGMSAKDVAELLEEKEIVENSSYLRRYISKEDLEEKVLAGRFELSPSMSIKEITSIITDESKAKNYITIPEGYSIKQIDTRLTEQKIILQGSFIDAAKKFSNYNVYPFLPRQQMIGASNPLEGFLFPDTYKIDPENFYPENLIDLMLKNFEKKLPTDINQQLVEKKITFFELITVASMLEKEARHADDFPIIAGIIWKRANSGWFLNIDASILYTINTNKLTSEDLKRDTPYNTYTRKGLPLGPISNPGTRSIEAALNPIKSNYWFYITDPKTGKAIYATTNEIHNRNRAKHLQ